MAKKRKKRLVKKSPKKKKAARPKVRRKVLHKIRRRRKMRRFTRKPVSRPPYYGLNPKFQFLGELRNLVLTSPPASFDKLAKKIGSLGGVKLALASGVFLNKENVADLLIVGDSIDRRRFKNFLKTLEAEVGTQVLYAIMDREEFVYRRAMFDRFVRMMLEGPHEVLIDRIGL